ncbi:MAG: YwiC-like family protein [Myxococcales bacterium]|jgi:hypothetical protein|nr:YwiC-like family protein [Myxococcales bacterium]HQY63191.1 YwiC-like family protein [Polyangiaceae bacterium]
MPREHGAYGQLLMPLVTAFLLGGLRVGSVALTVGVLAAFFAHESVLLLLGQRGRRAKDTEARRARFWGLALGALAIAGGGVGMLALGAAGRASLAVLAVLAAVLFGFILAKREKSLAGELVAAVALTGVSFPVALAGGAPVGVAAMATLVWALGFSLAVLAVRGVLAATSTKAGGGPTAGRISCASAVIVIIVAAALAVSSGLPAVVPVALAPFAAASVALFVSPPHARQLKKVGWALVLASTVAGAILVVGPRG